MFHLLVDITHHGYGHVSQTTAVLNALSRLQPSLRITLRTTAPLSFLQSRMQAEFEYIPQVFDFGMKMHNAVDVDVAASKSAYRELHANWDEKVKQNAAVIRQLKPDLLLANVPYLSLAAAHQARVPTVAMCCLNWADLYRHYCVDDIESEQIYRQMLESYQMADHFLKVTPTMPMPELNNALEVAPIVRQGISRRSELELKFEPLKNKKLVMIAMGGMDFNFPVQNWPYQDDIMWIVPQSWMGDRTDMLSLESLQLHFTDLLASCDAVITKPGYGTFTEAAYAGMPVLYVTRQDWPEEPWLVQWLKQYGVCLEVARDQLWSGKVRPILNELWSLPLPSRPDADGAQEVADFLVQKYF